MLLSEFVAGVAEESGFGFFVTVHAGGHSCGAVKFYSSLRLDIAVAGRAFDLGGRVPRVTEENEVRKFVDAARRDGLFSHFGVACVAGFPGGERSAFGGGGGFVAERALQVQFGVALVGKRLGPRRK